MGIMQVRQDNPGFATGSADKEVKFCDFYLVGIEGGKRLSMHIPYLHVENE
jgi:hypothetical protein